MFLVGADSDGDEGARAETPYLPHPGQDLGQGQTFIHPVRLEGGKQIGATRLQQFLEWGQTLLFDGI